MLRRLLARCRGDHVDRVAAAWWQNLERNRTKRLTNEQMDNILGRWQ